MIPGINGIFPGGSAEIEAPFFSIELGALLYSTSTASITGAVEVASFSNTSYDDLTWELSNDNATLQVPVHPGISLIRLTGCYKFSSTSGTIPWCTHRKWDGAAYSGFDGNGSARVFVSSGDDPGRAFVSAILAVSGGERYRFYYEVGTAETRANVHFYHGVEVLPASTRYTFANKSSDQTGITTRTAITWNNEIVDSLGSHDTGSNTENFVIPSDTTGKARAVVNFRSTAATTSSIHLHLVHQGTDVAHRDANTNSFITGFGACSPVLSVANGDVIKADIESSASLGIDAHNDTWMTVEELPSDHRYCIAVKSAAQTISSGVSTAVQWDGVDTHDPEGMHDPSSNNTRINVPADATEARVTMQVITSNTAGTKYIWAAQDAGSVNVAPLDVHQSSNEEDLNVMGAWVPCAAFDYIEVYAYCPSTGFDVVSGSWFQVEFR